MTSDPMLVAVVIVGLVLAYVGVVRWLGRMLGRSQRLDPAATTTSAGLIFIIGAVCMLAAAVILTPLLRFAFDLESDAAPLGLSLAVQSVAAIWSAAVMLAMAAREPRGVAGLGLRRHRGPPALLLGLTAWLAFLPCFFAAGLLSTLVLPAFGHEPQPQTYIQDFMGDADARRSIPIWLAIVLINPAFEELIFRGALFGALRRRGPLWLAMLASALLFAALHQIDVALQVASLGLLLAWVYERTGSLVVPCVIHMLHNGMVLIMLATGALEV